jgi:hypothetical protein
MFDPTSRYAPLEIAHITLPDGRPAAYVRRRFLPRGSALPLLGETPVQAEDRLDLIAARTLGDPEHWWRIADANDALRPADLLTPTGRSLRVPIPEP